MMGIPSCGLEFPMCENFISFQNLEQIDLKVCALKSSVSFASPTVHCCDCRPMSEIIHLVGHCVFQGYGCVHLPTVATRIRSRSCHLTEGLSVNWHGMPWHGRRHLQV
uniref:Uncharacterized protein n=1 Tax=Physcomitrium patens TaxID=3218 RepID=A0A2K1KNE9_PHYPA|nr:hypothetical protein PHYPA_006201 [Physcomitrium patens]